MPYRGRLIWPFVAHIQRLNTSATAANHLGLASGYDPIFREPVTSNTADSRVYTTATVTCQVATERTAYEKQVQMPGGRELEFDVRLCVHYSELESAALLASDGSTLYQPSDRLTAIYRTDGTLVRTFVDPLYCVHAQDRSFGLSGLQRNLVLLYFADRREGTT